METPEPLQPWASLGANEQLALRQAYQAEIDGTALTCSLNEKMARFTAWLAQRGVDFTWEDLRRPKRG